MVCVAGLTDHITRLLQGVAAPSWTRQRLEGLPTCLMNPPGGGGGGACLGSGQARESAHPRWTGQRPGRRFAHLPGSDAWQRVWKGHGKSRVRWWDQMPGRLPLRAQPVLRLAPFWTNAPSASACPYRSLLSVQLPLAAASLPACWCGGMAPWLMS